MSFLRLIGDWLAGSGWAEAITAANVTTEGRVDGLLKGSHVTRGQWAHQVSAAALYVLQKRAYAAYKEEQTSEDTLDFDDWKDPEGYYFYTLFLAVTQSQHLVGLVKELHGNMAVCRSLSDTFLQTF